MKWSLDRARDPEGRRLELRRSPPSTRSRSQRPDTVVAEAEAPRSDADRRRSPPSTARSCRRSCSRRPPARRRRTRRKAFAEKPIGSGPFMLDAWKRGVSMTLKRNPYYWKKGEDGKPLPYLDELEFQIIPDDATRILKLQGRRDRRRRVHPLFARRGAEGRPEPAHGAVALHPRALSHHERAARRFKDGKPTTRWPTRRSARR